MKNSKSFLLILLVSSTFSLIESSFLCKYLHLNKYCTHPTKTQPFCSVQKRTSGLIIDTKDQDKESEIPSCSLDIDQLSSGRIVNGSTYHKPSNIIPHWANITLAQEGQKFAQQNLLSIGISALYGLFSVLTIPDIKEILLYTRQSDTPEKATKRYLATAVQVILWYEELLTKTDISHNAWLTSLINVRDLHRNAMEHAFKHGFPLYNKSKYSSKPLNEIFWSAFEKDLKSSSIPMLKRKWPDSYLKYNNQSIPLNQFTLGMTQFSFIGFAILNPASVYLWEDNYNEEGLQGLVHLWAIIGHGLGINDEFNVCLKPDLKGIKKYFQEIKDSYFTPALFQIDNEVKVLLESLMSTINDIVPFAQTFPNGIPKLGTTFFIRLIRDAWEIPVINQLDTLSGVDKVFEDAWDYFITPSITTEGMSSKIMKVALQAIQLAIDVIFGPFKTNMEKATYVLLKSKFDD